MSDDSLNVRIDASVEPLTAALKETAVFHSPDTVVVPDRGVTGRGMSLGDA